MRQGGLTMERTSSAPDPRDTWAAWLRAAMTRHYGEGFRNKQLAHDAGFTEQTVSRWLKAESGTPSIDLVRVAARVLNANLAEAVRAAGYGDFVDEVAAALTPAQRADAKTEAELRHELAALQDEVNARINELRHRLDRRGGEESGTRDEDAVS